MERKYLQKAPRPAIEQIQIVLINEMALMDAQHCVAACEYCSEIAAISFDYLLDALTGSDPTVTEYIMCRPAHCPSCFCKLTEKTRIVVR
jgi:hypothetical protein